MNDLAQQIGLIRTASSSDSSLVPEPVAPTRNDCRKPCFTSEIPKCFELLFQIRLISVFLVSIRSFIQNESAQGNITMWIITRNKKVILQQDGSWGYRTTNSAKLFESHQSAVDWIEQESLPREYVSIDCFEHALVEDRNRQNKQVKAARARLHKSKYVSLLQPVEFYKLPDVDDNWCFPVFDKFTATHAVLCGAHVMGAFGMTSDEEMPFYCYSDEEYCWAFEECYTQRQPSLSTHDYRAEGF